MKRKIAMFLASITAMSTPIITSPVLATVVQAASFDELVIENPPYLGEYKTYLQACSWDTDELWMPTLTGDFSGDRLLLKSMQPTLNMNYSANRDTMEAGTEIILSLENGEFPRVGTDEWKSFEFKTLNQKGELITANDIDFDEVTTLEDFINTLVYANPKNQLMGNVPYEIERMSNSVMKVRTLVDVTNDDLKDYLVKYSSSNYFSEDYGNYGSGLKQEEVLSGAGIMLTIPMGGVIASGNGDVYVSYVSNANADYDLGRSSYMLADVLDKYALDNYTFEAQEDIEPFEYSYTTIPTLLLQETNEYTFVKGDIITLELSNGFKFDSNYKPNITTSSSLDIEVTVDENDNSNLYIEILESSYDRKEFIYLSDLEIEAIDSTLDFGDIYLTASSDYLRSKEILVGIREEVEEIEDEEEEEDEEAEEEAISFELELLTDAKEFSDSVQIPTIYLAESTKGSFVKGDVFTFTLPDEFSFHNIGEFNLVVTGATVKTEFSSDCKELKLTIMSATENIDYMTLERLEIVVDDIEDIEENVLFYTDVILEVTSTHLDEQLLVAKYVMSEDDVEKVEDDETEDEIEGTPFEFNNIVKIKLDSVLASIDGNLYTLEAPPFLQQETFSTMIPVRFVSVAVVGNDVANMDNVDMIEYDNETRTAKIIIGEGKQQITVEFTDGSDIMKLNGVEQPTANGAKPEIIDGRMYVPIRSYAESLGITVGWDNDTKVVTLGDEQELEQELELEESTEVEFDLDTQVDQGSSEGGIATLEIVDETEMPIPSTVSDEDILNSLESLMDLLD